MNVKRLLSLGLRDRRATTALEFGLIGSVAIMAIIFVLQIGLYLYIQVSLDYATGLAARQMQTGQGRTATTNLASFKTATLCASFIPMLQCGNILVNLQPVGDYSNTAPPISGGQASQSSLQFNPGVAANLMVLQVVYMAPNFLMSLVPASSVTFNGSSAFPITSTAAFRNES